MNSYCGPMVLATALSTLLAVPGVQAQDQRRPDPRAEQIRRLEKEIQDLKTQLRREQARARQQRNQPGLRQMTQGPGAWRWQARGPGARPGGGQFRAFAGNRPFGQQPGPWRFQSQRAKGKFGPGWRHHHRSRWHHRHFGQMNRQFRNGRAAPPRGAGFRQFDRFGPSERGGFPGRPPRPAGLGAESSHR